MMLVQEMDLPPFVQVTKTNVTKAYFHWIGFIALHNFCHQRLLTRFCILLAGTIRPYKDWHCLQRILIDQKLNASMMRC
uniref:Uncharacterized protein n=1 Tax=Rhizophora mucronata TaxID=61149 RepID=A0A2P2QQF6_RHIMU